MNIYLMIGTVLANAISVLTVYKLIKGLGKRKSLLYIAISISIMYIIISIVYWFSGIGMNKDIHEASKNFVTYLFVPINMFLTVPYLAAQYMKLLANEIKRDKFAKKVEIVAIIFVIVLIVEFFYFRNIQSNIAEINASVSTSENSAQK